jgi:acetyl-CoA synthetase
MTGDGIAMTFSVVDYPTTDATDWACATRAALAVHAETGARFAIVSTLPELMPEDVAAQLMAGGVVPFLGLREALAATDAATRISAPAAEPVCLPGSAPATEVLTEATAKAALAEHGLPVPQNRVLTQDQDMAAAIADLRAPFAVKGTGLAHKSEHGAVRLGIAAEDVPAVAADIGTAEVLVEEMITGTVAELLIGVVRDPAHGFVMTIGAGGVLTELLRDTVSFLLPARPDDVKAALAGLKIAPMVSGYRGAAAADEPSLLAAIAAVQSYVLANAETVSEVEINPLLCNPDRAVAVDALIRKA